MQLKNDLNPLRKKMDTLKISTKIPQNLIVASKNYAYALKDYLITKLQQV